MCVSSEKMLIFSVKSIPFLSGSQQPELCRLWFLVRCASAINPQQAKHMADMDELVQFMERNDTFQQPQQQLDSSALNTLHGVVRYGNLEALRAFLEVLILI